MTCHARLGARRSPAVDGHLSQVAQLTREVFNVSAGTTVNLGRVLTSQECDAWSRHIETRVGMYAERGTSRALFRYFSRCLANKRRLAYKGCVDRNGA